MKYIKISLLTLIRLSALLLPKAANLFLTKDDLSKSEAAYGKTKSRNRLLGTFEFGDRSRHPIDKKSFNKKRNKHSKQKKTKAQSF